MKVVKRDGRIISYDRSKVITAIERANNDVENEEKANKEEIKMITAYIEETDKPRILAEDIQEIIGAKLVEFGRNELATKYIDYGILYKNKNLV